VKVREWLNKEPVVLRPEATVGEVAKTLADLDVRHVAVIDGQGRLAGIITAADLLTKHAEIHMPTYFSLLGYSVPIGSQREEREIERALATTAGDLMSTDLVTIGPDEDVDTAATLMLDRKISCLPIVDGDKLLGVLDEMDIVRLLAVEEAEPDRG
jgi:CBS domain-containing protein